MLAIIGGSGLTTLSNLDVSHREVVRTPYGEPSGAVVFGQICGQPAMFLPRHVTAAPGRLAKAEACPASVA